MLHTDFNEALKASIKSQDACAMRTIRLILASLKDREICARTSAATANGAAGEAADGAAGGIDDASVLSLLQTMVKQRVESIRLYEEGGRQELADQEREEIEVIKRFMPQPLSDSEVDQAVREAIGEVGARDMKDMGKTMALLKQRYPGRMDFHKASGLVRQALTG